MTPTELQDLLARTIQNIAATQDESLKAELLSLASLVVAQIKQNVSPAT